MPTTIQILELLCEHQMKDLCRLARAERRSEHEHYARMIPLEAFESDLSQFRSAHPEDDPAPAPELYRISGKNLEGVHKLVAFLRRHARPALVKFNTGPSKAGESRIRWAAKQVGYALRFYRLVGEYAVLQIYKQESGFSADDD